MPREDEVQIIDGIEFRRSRETGDWIASCPECHGPVQRGVMMPFAKPSALCPICDLVFVLERHLNEMLAEMNEC